MADVEESELMIAMPPAGVPAFVNRSSVLRILWTGRLLVPLSALAISLLLLAVAVVLLHLGVIQGRMATGILFVLALMAVTTFFIGAERLHSQLLKPLARLEHSVAQVCQGEPGARLPLESSGILDPMVRDIDSLSEELTGLYEDMDSRVARHAARLAQKTGSLRVLYDVAASINHSDDLDVLLLRYMRVMKDMVKGRSATMQLKNGSGRMRIIGCIDLEGRLWKEEEILPVRLCRCGRTLSPGDILCLNNARECSRLNDRRMFGPNKVEQVSVPLEYQDTALGVCYLYVDRPGISGREDIMELLTAIGNHLGMALAKQRSDIEARRLSIVEERNHLAHELHDSLAQTLASLRFQVRMLEETLEQEDTSPKGLREAQRIRNGLDEAHTELRDLLTSFRAPVGERGLVQSLEKVIERFQHDTGIATFLQQNCRQPQLSATEEMQMVRIVQEALANIRKHANAHTVRVLLRCQAPNKYLLLVEDDGVGFEEAVPEGHPGEHIGLSIMEERAKRVGGELRVESEPGEGTRVEFLFAPASVGEGRAMNMKLLLIDDHALFRVGLRELLERRGIQVIDAVGNCQRGIDLVVARQPDVVLLDMRMPDMSGLDVLKRLREANQTMPIAMLTTSRDEKDVIDSLQNGAQGYLLKDMEPNELIKALEDIVNGETVVAKELTAVLAKAVKGDASSAEPESPFFDLTPREMEILCHLAEGQSNKVIARNLGISDGTVKLHVKAILRKLGVHSRVEAAVIAVERNMCSRGQSDDETRAG